MTYFPHKMPLQLSPTINISRNHNFKNNFCLFKTIRAAQALFFTHASEILRAVPQIWVIYKMCMLHNIKELDLLQQGQEPLMKKSQSFCCDPQKEYSRERSSMTPAHPEWIPNHWRDDSAIIKIIMFSFFTKRNVNYPRHSEITSRILLAFGTRVCYLLFFTKFLKEVELFSLHRRPYQPALWTQFSNTSFSC